MLTWLSNCAQRRPGLRKSFRLPAVKKYEYKTVEMPFRFGILKQGMPDIEAVLNAEGENGWRLHQIVVPAGSNFGQSEKMIAILEREKTA